MTLLVLAMLAVAWLGYFVMWARERRSAMAMPRNKTQAFSSFITAFSTASLPSGSRRTRRRGALGKPVTRSAALRRRRQIVGLILLIALVSLAAVPFVGASALLVHLVADTMLVLFSWDALRRRQAADQRLASVRTLYPDRPASDAEIMPLRRIVNG